MDIKIPVIVRLEGTNAEEGRKILAESILNFKIAQNFQEAAQMAVAAVNN
jgi:succinyl-CoA synthetase beta subunit